MQAGAKPFPQVLGYGFCNPNLLSNGLCNCTKTTCGAGLLDADEALRRAYGPAVVIEPIGAVRPAATITLDGSRSKSISGRDIESHQWELLSGPATITIPDDDQAITSLSLPDVPGSWVFQLTVEDDAGDRGTGTITVVASNPVTGGGGGGSTGWAWGVGLWAWVLALGWRQRRR
jgi:serine protease